MLIWDQTKMRNLANHNRITEIQNQALLDYWLHFITRLIYEGDATSVKQMQVESLKKVDLFIYERFLIHHKFKYGTWIWTENIVYLFIKYAVISHPSNILKIWMPQKETAGASCHISYPYILSNPWFSFGRPKINASFIKVVQYFFALLKPPSDLEKNPFTLPLHMAFGHTCSVWAY